MSGKNKNSKKLIFVIAFKLLFVSNFLFAQISVSGKVVDQEDKTIEKVSVLLYKNDNLLDYTFTNAQGEFNFSIKKKGSYLIRLTSLSYESQDKLIEVKDTNLSFLFALTDKNNQLEEIILKINRDIEVRKDTIIFKASAFENKRQVVLEDLLKDIPGIQVSDNGTIKFQGKLVTNVKIENDDLFNGGYKIITKNLKANLVDKVQLLQNYSENPLLKDVRDTEDVAINITLKEDRKTSLFGDIDALSNAEDRHHIHSNLISFLDKSKFYVITDYNNIGKDSYIDFKNIFSSKSDNPTISLGEGQKASIYTTLNTRRPNFDDQYVNLNDSEFYNGNAIFNVSDKAKIKLLFLTSDNKKRFLTDQFTEFVTDPPVVIDEGSIIEQRETLNIGKINFNWRINKNSILEYDGYLTTFSFDGNSIIDLPDNSFEEGVRGRGRKMNNFMNYTLKNKDSSVVQFTARYIYDDKPQNYQVSPFPYPNTFGTDYSGLESVTKNKLRYGVAQVSYLKRFEKNNLESYLGFSDRRESLNSNFQIRNSNSGQLELPDPTFLNNGFQHQSLFYVRNRFRRNINNVNVALSLDVNIEQNKVNNDQRNFTYVNSNLQVKYTPSKKHEINFISGLNHFTNTLSNLNDGYIPLNYRNFTRGLQDNQLQRYFSAISTYTYGNWTDKFTGGVNLGYTYGDKYLSFNSEIEQDLTRITKIILNGKTILNGDLYVDRYLKFINTNLKLKYALSRSRYENKVNNNIRQIRSNGMSYGFELRSNFSSFFDYHVGFNWNQNEIIIDNFDTEILNKNGFVDFDFSLNRFTLNFENDIYFFDEKSNADDYLFSNFRLNYRVNNNLSLQIKANNLTNNKSFLIYSQTDFSQFLSETQLIERYVLMGVNYKF